VDQPLFNVDELNHQRRGCNSSGNGQSTFHPTSSCIAGTDPAPLGGQFSLGGLGHPQLAGGGRLCAPRGTRPRFTALIIGVAELASQIMLQGR